MGVSVIIRDLEAHVVRLQKRNKRLKRERDEANTIARAVTDELTRWTQKARKLGEKLRTANLDLRTCPGCGKLCGPDPHGVIYEYCNLHRWHIECHREAFR